MLKAAVFSFTSAGEALATQVAEALPEFDVTCVNKEQSKLEGGLSAVVKKAFEAASLLVFIGAAGIAVRAIAPCVQSKFSDPAVLVIDEKGQFVISLLSGHVGGGNAYAQKLAETLTAQAVITTATDVNGLGSLDLLLKPLKVPLMPFRESIIQVNQALLRGETVAVYAEPCYSKWLVITNGFVLFDDFEQFIASNDTHKIWIGHSQIEFDRLKDLEVCRVIPKTFVLGTGCKKELPFEGYEQAFRSYIKEQDILPEAILKLASVDIKATENCMMTLIEKYALESVFFSIEALKPFERYYETSEWVKQTLGIGSVAQPSAHLASGTQVTAPCFKGSGCTFAIGRIN